MRAKFPSPIGELHFSILYSVHDEKFDIRFPSPIGELHFSIGGIRIDDERERVSVPYRGATFLNERRYTTEQLESVSVPYRGATFLNGFHWCEHQAS